VIAAAQSGAAAAAFDSIAESYDSIFTESVIGRSQRTATWREAVAVFPAEGHILELNCGTGEDALFLARNGFTVTACDASPRMISRARARAAIEAPGAPIEFSVLCSENLLQLPPGIRYDGVFSNFSGLNCVADLAGVAADLAGHLPAGARLLLCFSTRFCMWEMLHYLSRGRFRRAFRRLGGFSRASVGGHAIPVFYPTLGSIQRSFRRHFRLCRVTGIGIFVPPSYMETWARRNRSIFGLCEKLDGALCRVPLLRTLGDHMLLELERI
jgi:SAM-dependent methyltransferase